MGNIHIRVFSHSSTSPRWLGQGRQGQWSWGVRSRCLLITIGRFPNNDHLVEGKIESCMNRAFYAAPSQRGAGVSNLLEVANSPGKGDCRGRQNGGCVVAVSLPCFFHDPGNRDGVRCRECTRSLGRACPGRDLSWGPRRNRASSRKEHERTTEYGTVSWLHS